MDDDGRILLKALRRLVDDAAYETLDEDLNLICHYCGERQPATGDNRHTATCPVPAAQAAADRLVKRSE